MKIDSSASSEAFSKERRDKLVKIASVAVCLVILYTIGILAWALPQPTYSEHEKRDLNQMPEFSIASLFKGEYTQKVELAYADTFTFREAFIKLQAMIEKARGIRVEGAAIYAPSSTSDNVASTGQPHLERVTVHNPGETVEGLLVYKGAGFLPFSASNQNAEAYASVINKYHDAFDKNVQVYSLLVPNQTEFYSFPKKYQNLSDSQKDVIEYIYSLLDCDIATVDAYSVLEAHSDEYLYFNTDHHWTGLGAYYAYTAFMEAAGLDSYSYASYTKHIIEPFLGSIYGATTDRSLYNNPDYVEWCEFPVANRTYQYKTRDLSNYDAVSVMADYADYAVFLGGDLPLTIIKTDVDNGRKLAIIKESYGNALATFAASGFEETYVVDERYYEGNIVDLVNSRGITDVLLINNILFGNTPFFVEQLEKLLTQSYSGAIAYPEE